MKDRAAENFQNHAMVAAGVAVVGLALAAALPQTPENRWPALVGTGPGSAAQTVSVYGASG